MNTTELLEKAVSAGASDIFVVAGRPVSMRIHGDIRMEDNIRLLPDDTQRIIEQIYELAGHRDINVLEDTGDDDFSFAVPGLSRFRVSAFKQRGSMSVVIRIISFTLPDPAAFGIPEKIIRFADFSKGMVLVTGPAGSGKSTTLACIIDHINKNYDKHIITLEDPLEFLHRHNRSIVSQREINVDTENYITALRASLRQSPDVILLGFRAFEKDGILYLTSNKKIKKSNNIGKGTITVTIPEDMAFNEIELNMKAGKLKADQIRTKNLEVNAGAGEVNILEFQAEEAEFVCGAGSVTASGDAGKKLAADCGVGELLLNLKGVKEDYNYDLECGIGEIRCADENYSGFGKDYTIDNHAAKNMEIECGIGQIAVKYMNQM